MKLPPISDQARDLETLRTALKSASGHPMLPPAVRQALPVLMRIIQRQHDELRRLADLAPTADEWTAATDTGTDTGHVPTTPPHGLDIGDTIKGAILGAALDKLSRV